MNSHLIYVFSDEDKAHMISWGYTLMSEDKRNHVYAFREGTGAKFESLTESGIKFVKSNTLTL